MNTHRKSQKDIEWQILRWGTHIGSLIPLALLVYDYFTFNLTANPIQAATQRTGRTAITLLVIMLACTPINILFRTTIVTRLRKPLGLYALLYAGIHFIIFTIIDYGLVLPRIITTFSQKPYLLLGLATFLVLILMGLTSFKWWMRRWARIGKDCIVGSSSFNPYSFSLCPCAEGRYIWPKGKHYQTGNLWNNHIDLTGNSFTFCKKGIILSCDRNWNMRSINMKSNISPEKSNL